MSDIEIKDMLGIDIVEDDLVVYGRSNRNKPINIGIVKGFKVVDNPTKSYYLDILIQGKGNTKLAMIPNFHSNRLVVLPDSFKDGLYD